MSTNVTDAKVEQVNLEHFLRNMVKVYSEITPELENTALKYQQLQKVLQQELEDVLV